MSLTVRIDLDPPGKGEFFDIDELKAMVIDVGEAAIEKALDAIDNYAVDRLVYFCQRGQFQGDD